MNDIFSFNDEFRPLCDRMRPRFLDEYIGQSHLLGKGKVLSLALERKFAHSMIFWGTPGSGKTTLARILASHLDLEVIEISAVTAGVKDIREAVEKAKQFRAMGKRTLVFVDEVHRFNKSQQDAFLPHIENGLIIFIGATTENPSFELNNALLSRCKVYRLKRLDKTDILQILQQALKDDERGLGDEAFQIEKNVLEHLSDLANGDARLALNSLELMADMAEIVQGAKQLTLNLLKEVLDRPLALGDKNGDLYYDLLSALHKSIRGSDPNAALYWYARMLKIGCDPLVVSRRLLAIASEDIGNADIRAMTVALNADECYRKVGAAEGERAIAQAVIFLACCAKSNAVYTAFNQMKELVNQHQDYPVPYHLRNAPTNLMKELGYGKEYRYAHNEPNAFAAGENYFPQELKEIELYKPTNRGLEKQISEKLELLKQFNQESHNKRYE